MNLKNLRDARQVAGLTQKEAADMLGVSLSAYKNYEQGNREPNNNLLCKIADLFGVTTDYLLGRKPPEPDALDKALENKRLTALEKKIVHEYIEIPPENRAGVMDFLQKAVSEVMLETAQEQVAQAATQAAEGKVDVAKTIAATDKMIAEAAKLMKSKK